MNAQVVKTPGPDHPITIDHNPKRVVVMLGSTTIADTHNALTLKEARYPAVQYIPRADVDMTLLTPSTKTSYCPYKGEATYFSLPGGTEQSRDAVWSYEAPYASVAEIAGHLAFYPDKVDVTERD